MDIEAMGIEFVKMIIPEIILAVLPLPLKFLKIEICGLQSSGIGKIGS